MTRRILACCGGAGEGAYRAADFNRILKLDIDEPGANVNLRVHNVSAAVLSSLSPLTKDLLDVATYVYVLDSSIPRGGLTDVYGTRWPRDFVLRIAIRDEAAWNARADQLSGLLSYLTDDRYTFEFTQHGPNGDQEYLDFDSHDPVALADCVCLFSGGADSLAGTLKLATEGHKPLLVSHRSTPILDHRQKNLRGEISRLFTSWEFPHLSVWAHRKGRARDHTQRSRSFLYLSLAAAVAFELQIDFISIPENGIVSFNLPKVGQAVGARASRSTQPRFIAGFEDFVRGLFGVAMRVENPFLFKTKAEVLEVLKTTGHPELLQESVSCAHTMGRSRVQPHCGQCSQCVDRRFAGVAAGMRDHDLPERYEVDIFTASLSGEGRNQAEAYVRAAHRFARATPDEFVRSYRQVTDALRFLPGSADSAATTIYDLHRRFAKQTLEAFEAESTSQLGRIVRGEVPPGSLLAMVAEGRLQREPAALLAARISELLRHDLPIRYQSEKPSNERKLCDDIEATLKTAEERLAREAPQIPYSVVQIRPDFSSEEAADRLFVEAKLVKDSDSRRYAVRSISEGSSYYSENGAWVLFVVYDIDRLISDDEEFARPFEEKSRVIVSVIR